jgi:hypothetical protein
LGTALQVVAAYQKLGFSFTPCSRARTTGAAANPQPSPGMELARLSAGRTSRLSDPTRIRPCSRAATERRSFFDERGPSSWVVSDSSNAVRGTSTHEEGSRLWPIQCQPEAMSRPERTAARIVATRSKWARRRTSHPVRLAETGSGRRSRAATASKTPIQAASRREPLALARSRMGGPKGVVDLAESPAGGGRRPDRSKPSARAANEVL